MLDNGSPASTVGGVLGTLALTSGPMPRVLLRDSEDFNGSGPIVRSTSPEVPDCVGRLQLLGEIARGGMGAVLKGRDNDLGRDVAIKVLRKDLRGDGDLVRRFVEEAQIAGQLQHPGVVPIYEMGTFDDRRPFFCMKLVKGETLAKLLAGRKSPAEGQPRLLSIFESISQTVAYSHARGVIHRDLKPSNVMVGSFGEVQVMDWGLAKVLPRGGVADDVTAGMLPPSETVIATARSGSDAPDLSKAGSVLGTPSYMAPEQARGEIDRIDERADVFALGSILCEILTGQPAFLGRSSGEILRKAATGDLADTCARLEASGADVELIVLAKECLAREPEDRPGEAGVVSARITAYLTGVQEKLRRAELEGVEERGRRRLTTVVAAALILLGLLGGGGYVWSQNQRAERMVKTAQAVDDALADAARLRGEAQADPIGQASRWGEALSAAKRAKGLLAQGEADAPLKGRVEALLVQLDRERDAAAEKARVTESDRLLLGRLEAVRVERLATGDVPDAQILDAKLGAAFREFGHDVDRMQAAEAGAELGGRAASIEIAAALDDWVDARRAAQPDNETWKHLLAVAEAVDPDPLRSKLRTNRLRPGPDGFRRLTAEAIENPDLPAATFVRLANSLGFDGNAAVDVLRAGHRRHPGDFVVNVELARLCRSLGRQRERDLEDALRCATAAVALRPRSPVAHTLLGCIFLDMGGPVRADAAITEFREAARLGPEFAVAHNNLGFAIDRVGGDLAEAVAAWREAVRLDDSLGSAWYALGRNLILLGDFEASADAMRRAQLLLPSGGSVSQPDPAGYLARAERYIVLKKRLPGVLRGDEKPSPAERIEFARMCFGLSLYATSARLARQAYTEAPELLENVPVGRRYYLGVCASARAGCGEGKDDPAPTEAERAQFREQALRWFRDELESWKRRFAEGSTSSRMNIRDTLEAARRKNVSLGGVSDPARLAKLPEAEQTAWRAVWAEVDAILAEWKDLGRDMDAAITAELERRLPALLRNEEQPANQDERLRLARLCYHRRLHASSARFYSEALKNDALLFERPASRDRYNAACAAALAGCGESKDEPSPAEDARASLRRQAFGWLNDELVARRRAHDAGLTAARPPFIKELKAWKADADFAGVREPDALAKLPEVERQRWRALWTEVDALLTRAGGDKPM